MLRYFFLLFFQLLLLALIAFPCRIYAQKNTVAITQTVTGRVTDKDVGAPIYAAGVIVMGIEGNIAAVTDTAGYFILREVPVGRRTFRISCVGYSEALLQNIEVTSGKQVVLNVQLQEKSNSLSEVAVVAKRDKDRAQNSMISVSGRTFSIEESNRYAGGFGDLTRMAQSFAGVASADGESNEIVIRGNSPRGLLWRIEGVEVVNPNHFPRGDGSAGGGISILQANMIDNSDFLTGAFPAEYGNASSGVFDVKLRKGNENRHEASIQLGVIGLEASAEGPLSRKNHSSYLLKYRYSTVALLTKMGIKLVDNTVVPTYQDLTFHLNFGNSKAGTFSLFGLAGLSSAGEKAVKDSTKWKNSGDRRNQLERYATGIFGLKHYYLFKDNKTSFTTVLSYNIQDALSKNDSLQNDYSAYPLFNRTLQYHTARLSFMMNHKRNIHETYRAGVILSIPIYNLKARAASGLNSYTQLLDEKGQGAFLQAYVQQKYRLDIGLELNAGVHMLYHFLNNTYSIEPRLGMRYNVKPLHAISLGFGLHSRLEPISVYLQKVLNAAGFYDKYNKSLSPSRAFHAVLGYDFSFWENMRFRTEVYFQYLYNVPIAKENNSDFSMINYNGEDINQVLVNRGKGYNYGMEITVEKFYSKNYYFLFTASVFNSRFKASSGNWYSSRFNGNYIFNVVGGKDFNFGKRKNMTLGANTRLVTMGGNRKTPIDLDASKLKGETVYDPGATYSQRYPAYFRWDVGVYFKMNRRKYSWKLSVDFQNITDRKNVFSTQYNPILGNTENSYGLGFIPVLNWKIDF